VILEPEFRLEPAVVLGPQRDCPDDGRTNSIKYSYTRSRFYETLLIYTDKT
jgi:hypothetical protein